jgi:phosphoribosyl 1,2-cyclic phosphodiesterase
MITARRRSEGVEPVQYCPMTITFWGVRGSIPTPDADHMRWGGNTSCLEVSVPGEPPLILDCGTGIRRLGQRIASAGASRVDILLSHVHIDHVVGLPFFAPLHQADVSVTVTVPAFSDEEASEKITRYLNGTLHPLRLADMTCNLVIAGMRPGEPFKRAGFEVTACALNHPGGSLAYRIERGGRTFCYVTDTAPLAVYGEGVAAGKAMSTAEERVSAFLQGADFVVFDTMFSEAEYVERMTWGHAYPEYAAALCAASGVKTLCLFHHLPSADDDRMDALAKHWQAAPGPMRVVVAREGETVEVGGQP